MYLSPIFADVYLDFSFIEAFLSCKSLAGTMSGLGKP